jgi:radical SAM superfamily enzyme YgiQ (UPF0313 family)
MNKKILLINPWIHDFAAYDLWSKPFGLLTIAAILRQNGYDVNFIDCLNPFHPHMLGTNKTKRKSLGGGKYFKEEIKKPESLKGIKRRFSRYGITPEVFIDELLALEKPDLILVTSLMTYWYTGVSETITTVRNTIPGVPIVLGGNYATLLRNHALKYSGADIVISAMGEDVLPELLNDVFGEKIEFLPDPGNLDSFPYPAFDLLPYLDQVPLMTSRGCPYRCSYCASHILNSGFKIRDPIRVVDEIEFWRRNFNVTNFSFYDDALLVDAKERAVPMLKEIIRRKIDCSFHCPNGLHIRGINEEVSILMFRSGFRTLRFGLETAQVERQRETGGKVTNEEAADAVEHLKRAGYKGDEIGMYLLCGLPYQTFEEVRDSIAFVKSFGSKPIITEFSPIPGTDIWNDAVKCSPFPIAEEPLFHNNTLMPCRWEGLTYDMYGELKKLARSNDGG